MKDRVPTQAVNGAIRMEQLDAEGNHIGYIYLKRADEPSEEGTPYNKNNVLTDETAMALGLIADNNPSPNDAFAQIANILFNVPIGRITLGKYIGTGTVGIDNPNTLTFDFDVKFLAIWHDYGVELMTCQQNASNQYDGESASYRIYLWNGNTVSWYAINADASTPYPSSQFNSSGRAYYYFAVGVKE